MAATLTRTPAPVEVDLDTRLTLASVAMDALLDQAQLAFDINTAHLPTPAIEPPEPQTLPAPDPQPTPSSPLAAVYLGAIQVIRERGWTRGNLRDEHGAVCAVGAIRAAAGPDRGLADDACAHLLTVIQRQFAAETVPAWNDQQSSAAPVIRILGTAADHA